MKLTVKVFIIDEHYVIREGLRSTLERDPNIEVLGEAASFQEALESLRSLRRCDLFIMDLMVKGTDCAWFIEQILHTHAKAGIALFTADTDTARVMQALEAGVNGYVAQSSGPEAILRAVHEIHVRGCYLDDSAATLVLQEIRDKKTRTPSPTLTDQDRFILSCLAQGLNNTEIASRLFVSVSTVKTHLRALYKKFSTTDRTKLAVRAVREGHIQEPHSLAV